MSKVDRSSFISKKLQQHISYERSSWEEEYHSLQRDTIRFFILDADTVGKYGWNDVRNNNRILKRYDISLQYMNYLNEGLSYPPNEKVSKVLMWALFNE